VRSTSSIEPDDQPCSGDIPVGGARVAVETALGYFEREQIRE
jgi:hypothetical protein